MLCIELKDCQGYLDIRLESICYNVGLFSVEEAIQLICMSLKNLK